LAEKDAIGLADIDDFKMFNNQYGNGCTDSVLVKAADAIIGDLGLEAKSARKEKRKNCIILRQTVLDDGLCKDKRMKKEV
jgi:GGDEF domain-containing protein